MTNKLILSFLFSAVNTPFFFPDEKKTKKSSMNAKFKPVLVALASFAAGQFELRTGHAVAAHGYKGQGLLLFAIPVKIYNLLH